MLGETFATFADGEDNVEMCARLDATSFQESWSWRNVTEARALAKALIDDGGLLKKGALVKEILYLEENLYSLGPGRHHDRVRREHILQILRHLQKNNTLRRTLKRISKPEGHPLGETLIRETLFLGSLEKVTDAHARQAALSALLTLLRQNVGSCFATAPAILVQQEYPERLLDDLGQLLGTGRLHRVIEGEEFHVPLSASWGVGDLFRPSANVPHALLATSPGLAAALEAAGIEESCAALLARSSLPSDLFARLTPDKIIRALLRTSFDLTEKEIETFHHQEVLGGGMFAPTPQMGKGALVGRYEKALTLARQAFKAITENALLKAWEYTLASFAETKANFAQWNLSSSLGLHPDEPGGLGEVLRRLVEEKIDAINEEIKEHESRYDHLYAQAKSLEGRATSASQGELGWVQAEYRIRRMELNRLAVERDEAHERGRKLAHLFSFLITYYAEKFKAYFQEVYDAQMHDLSPNPYDDSPAGFRLLYKHGRTHSSTWTLIHTPADFLQALASFFVATEIDLSSRSETEGLQAELTDLVTTAITHIKRPEFLESAFVRLAKAYREPLIKDPLNNLEKVARKPWAYLSGGTMNTLVSHYFGRATKPTEKARWVESPTELLAFLIDTCKDLPLSVQKAAEQDHSLLAFSPTHAFLCQPGRDPFCVAWKSDVYTYTWIRDQWVIPQQHFLTKQSLTRRMIDVLFDHILTLVPEGYRPVVKRVLPSLAAGMRPSEFRREVVSALSYQEWMQNHLVSFIEEIDRLLYISLPLFPDHEMGERLSALLDATDEIDAPLRTQLLHQFDALTLPKQHICSAKDLRDLAKELLIQVTQKTRHPIPYHQCLTQAMQRTGLGYPAPILFGDTNWVNNTFGFVVNPGSDALELWRFDECGSAGRPMHLWQPYLDGSDQREWGLYPAPHEYSP